MSDTRRYFFTRRDGWLLPGIVLFGMTLLWMWAVTGASAAPLATFTVNSTADASDAIAGNGICAAASGACTLRAAVEEANALPGADTILFAGSLSGSTITLTGGELAITGDVTITGPGATNLAVNGNSSNRLFNVATGVSVAINGLTITNGGNVENGAGIYNAGTLTINESMISANVALGNTAGKGGGGIFNSGALTLNDTDLTNNTATVGAGSGGAILNAPGATLVVNDGTIADNGAGRAGGGIEDNASNSVILTNVTFTGNSTGPMPGNGGALHMTGMGNVMVDGGMVTDNTAAAEGGGFWNGSGMMTVDGTTFDGNAASGAGADQGGGALFNEGGTLMVMNATITNNSADGTAGSGGGILNNLGTLEVSDSSIDSNSAIRAGGGIESNVGSTTLDNVDFDGNATGGSPGNGGALHITGAGSLEATGGDVTNNTAAAEGGGFWNGSGTMTVDGTTFDGNVASGAGADQGGGALFNAGGTLVVRNATITDNSAVGTAGSGGGILNDMGTLAVSMSEISNNSSIRAGGGIEDNGGAARPNNLVGSVTLDQVVMNENTTGGSPGNGGALHISGAGNVTVMNSSISGNEAVAEGGGLWNSAIGTLTVDRTTLVGNAANGSGLDQGGGALFNDGGSLTVSNSTLSMNMATSAGGGLLNTNSATTSLINVTIFENSADGMGGGVATNSGTVTLRNSIVAHESADGADCSGTIAATTPTLDSDGTCGASIEADPVLGPLADNGGFSGTHALLSGSPAIDAGDNTVCAAPPINGVDQRGAVRPQGAACDLGAYEREVPTAVTITSLNSAPPSPGGTRLLMTGLGALAGLILLQRRRAATG